MRLLVTGGAGFIGSNFIHYWREKYRKDSIINLDLLTYAGNLESLKDIGENRYEFVKGDIRDKELVDHLVSKVDLIVHFAAESHVDNSIDDPFIFSKTNVLGTHVLLDAARKYNVRFHHISTDEVFGSLDLDGEEKFNEESQYKPNSPYSASKAGSDMLVRSYFKTYGLKVTTTNCSNNYGPYQHPEKMIPKAIQRIIDGKKIPMMGDGKAIRDWLYVEDHCEAIDLVINKGEIGEIYCVGGNNEIPLKELISTICNAMNVDFNDHVEIIPDRPGHDMRYAISAEKIMNLGWKPNHDFRTGLAKTIEWYSKREDWWRPLLSDVKY